MDYALDEFYFQILSCTSGVCELAQTSQDTGVQEDVTFYDSYIREILEKELPKPQHRTMWSEP